MLLKISFNNVKKNVKDYSIYFLTLMIGVALVYSFNSLDSQTAFKEAMNEGTANITKTLFTILDILSKVVAVILAFLIIYANDFLMKRRKKELGIYMVLGMENRRISQIFVAEILMVGMLSFAVGIAVGTVLSQGISIIALKMFAFDLSSYQFAFSMQSLMDTLISFCIIFFVVILFNVRTISKVKLIEMLNAGRMNQVHPFKGVKLTLGIFVMGLAMLGTVAYLVYAKNAINPNSPLFSISFIVAVLGTACIIYAIFGLMLSVLRSMENWYFKGLNAFFIRQISSKIQTNYLTMTVVCLLLSATICIVATGMGMAFSMNNTAEEAAPYDISIFHDLAKSDEGDVAIGEAVTIESFLANKEIDLTTVMEKSVKVNIYEDRSLTYGHVIMDPAQLFLKDEALVSDPLAIMSLSDFNAIRVDQGLDPITLGQDGYALTAYYEGTNILLQNFLDTNTPLEVNGQSLKPNPRQLFLTVYSVLPINSNDPGTMIVNDEVVEGLEKVGVIYDVRYRKDADILAIENQLMTHMIDPKSPVFYFSKTLLEMMFYSTFAMASFICCYIGIVFLIISVAILSLQQLTETADNIYRYELLQKLGVDKSKCVELVFKQISVYFGTPLLLAMIYSAFVLPAIIEKISKSLKLEIGANVGVTLVLFIVIYGSYFAMTCFSCKNMVIGKIEASKA